LNYFIQKKPELVLSRLKSLKANLKCFLDHCSVKTVPKYSDYIFPKEVADWLNNEKDTKCLFLTGKSGYGKTEGIIYLLKGWNPLLITEINSLKNLKSDHKAIIFDDIAWSKFSREDKIHLLDKERTADIRVLYDVIKLPSEVLKVVTSNDPSDLINIFDTDKAILRRIKHIHLEKPLFNIENFVQNNITINLNSNED
jgi:hypothetical protein